MWGACLLPKIDPGLTTFLGTTSVEILAGMLSFCVIDQPGQHTSHQPIMLLCCCLLAACRADVLYLAQLIWASSVWFHDTLSSSFGLHPGVKRHYWGDTINQR